MDLNRMALIVLAVAGALQLGHKFRLRPVHPHDGVLAPAEPLQVDITSGPAIVHGHWMLTPRASYDVTARVLSREDYTFDRLSDLIPEDLALGWGPMSDNRILRDFKIEQSARFYSWRPLSELPIPRNVVISHSANTHVIPADTVVGSQLARVRIGQVVHLRGLLVDGARADGAYFHTSLSREDSGAGACEVLLVQEVEVR